MLPAIEGSKPAFAHGSIREASHLRPASRRQTWPTSIGLRERRRRKQVPGTAPRGASAYGVSFETRIQRGTGDERVLRLVRADTVFPIRRNSPAAAAGLIRSLDSIAMPRAACAPGYSRATGRVIAVRGRDHALLAMRWRWAVWPESLVGVPWVRRGRATRAVLGSSRACSRSRVARRRRARADRRRCR